MTPEQIEALGPAFASYLDQFLFCCDHTQTFALLGIYCRGLLSDLQRKTCEPIALAAGVAVRTVQEFLKDHLWHFDRTRDVLQQHVATLLPDVPDEDQLGTLGIHDDTATKKKGTKTPGVQRQWCGELGKTENCLVTVHTGVAKGRYKTLLDADLYLPRSWDQDRERCQEAGIPDSIVYRPKWRIALEQTDRLRAQGIRFDWMTFDEGYGDKPGYLRGLHERRQRFIGEVPKSFRCCGTRPDGRRASSRADDLVRHSRLFRRPVQVVRLARQTLGEQVWEVKAARVWLPWNRQRRHWLLWAHNPQTGEVKYFVSNAPARTAVRLLLRVAFQRWNVEHSFRLSKSEIGFRHFEGRHYTGLMRHLTLCLVTLTFVAGQVVQLRGEKPRGDSGAGVLGPELSVGDLVGTTTGHRTGAVQVGRPLLSAAA